MTYTTPLAKKLGAKAGAEVVFFFTTRRTELLRRFGATVQLIGLDAGLVDNKSAAIDDDWQAVRFVYRREDR